MSVALLIFVGDMGNVTSTKDPKVEEGDCRYLSREVLQEVSNFLLHLLLATGASFVHNYNFKPFTNS